MSESTSVFIYKWNSSDRPSIGNGQQVSGNFVSQLDPSDILKLKNLSSEKKKQEFIHSRILLKHVLKNFFGINAPNVFSNKFGKPQAEGVKFNLSHSGDYIVLAVNRKFDLGVDVERSQAKRHYLDVAKQYFSRTENLFILSGRTLAEKYKRFRSLWSLKESYVKAFNGVINKRSIKVHFDLPKNKIEKKPTKKPVQFLHNERLNISVCLVGKVTLSKIKVYQASTDRLSQMTFKKSRTSFTPFL